MAGATASPALALALALPSSPGGIPLPALMAMVGGVAVLLGVVVLVLALRRGRRPRRILCGKCRRVVLPEWTKCRFCGAMLREPKEAVLEFVSGPLLGQRLGLERDVTTIGAAPTNTVPLVDTGVSRKHIGIKRLDGEYELADLGSTNGVYVNGERVARRKLTVGDVIRVGTTEMVFKS